MGCSEVRDGGSRDQSCSDHIRVEGSPPGIGVHIDEGTERAGAWSINKRVEAAQSTNRLFDCVLA